MTKSTPATPSPFGQVTNRVGILPSVLISGPFFIAGGTGLGSVVRQIMAPRISQRPSARSSKAPATKSYWKRPSPLLTRPPPASGPSGLAYSPTHRDEKSVGEGKGGA